MLLDHALSPELLADDALALRLAPGPVEPFGWPTG